MSKSTTLGKAALFALLLVTARGRGMSMVSTLANVAAMLPVLERYFPSLLPNRAPSREAMERARAFEVLGIAPTNDRERIVEAHRRLMRLLHPDVGGSPFIASQVNEARDILLRN